MKKFATRALSLLLASLMMVTLLVTNVSAEDIFAETVEASYEEIDGNPGMGTHNITKTIVVEDQLLLKCYSDNDRWNVSSVDSSIVKLEKSGDNYLLTAVGPGYVSFSRDFYWIGTTHLGEYTRHMNYNITVLPKVTVEPVSVYEGLTANVSVTVNEGATLYYETADASIATVDQSGVVTGVNAGTTNLTVRATVNGQTNTATTTVTVGSNVSEISLSKDYMALKTGKSGSIEAYLSYYVAEGKTDQTITWAVTSGSEYISLASETGSSNTITALASEGTAEVTVSAGEKSAVLTVVVNSVGFYISPETAEIYVDGTKRLTVSSDDVSTGEYTTVWSSSDEAVATVDSNGLVRGVANGTANISAVVTYSGKEFDAGYCEVTVSNSIISVVFTQIDDKEITWTSDMDVTYPEGTTYYFRARPVMEDEFMEQPELEWTSTDETVGTATYLTAVSAKVTADRRGTTDIIASTGGRSAVAHLTVISNIETVKLPSEITLYRNSTYALFQPGWITYVDGAGYTVEDGDYSYSVLDSLASGIIDISDDGIITGRASGSTLVLVTVDGVEYPITVNVKDTFQSWDFEKYSHTMNVGDKLDLLDEIEVTYEDEDGQKVTEKLINSPFKDITDITWTSVNEDIVSVDDNGNIEALAPGYATISAKTGSKIINASIVVLTSGGKEPETPELRFSVVLHYRFGSGEHEGEEAAPDYIARYPAGSKVEILVESPTDIIGYTPETEVYSETVWGITGLMERTIYYYPSSNHFTVNYYHETTTTGEYELADTKIVNARTEDNVGLYVTLFDNSKTTPEYFYKLPYNKTVKVAADGSTIVNIYYRRLSYMVTFNLDGGTGTDPIYGIWGRSFSPADPTKYGYTFTGWYADEALTEPVDLTDATIPQGNVTYYAGWANATTYYRVIYWEEKYDSTEAENATKINQSNYSFYDTETLTGTTGEYTNATGISGGVTGCYMRGVTQKIIEGDGSTVVNVYYSRNWHTLTFKYEKKTVYTIRAKYGSYIAHHFTADDPSYLGSLKPAYQWESPESSCYKGYWVATLESMPDEDVTFNGKEYTNNKTLTYYLQKVGTTVSSTSWPSSDENFTKHKTIPYTNSLTPTYNEEYHEITGFTRYSKSLWSSSMTSYYYMRNSYKLSFISGDKTVKTETVQYEASLAGYDYTPADSARPSSVPSDYVFAGWYADPACTVKFDFSQKMPSDNMAVYAKWEPIKVTLTVISRYIDTPNNSLSFKVSKGTVFTGVQESWTKVPAGDNREFVGWFYENGDPFDFGLVINGDTTVRAQFSNDKVVNVIINYVSQDGKTTLAESTLDSSFEDLTVTYYACAVEEGMWFPVTSSHSFTLNPDEKGDDVEYDSETETYTYNFKYVEAPSVKYTVRYLEKDTNKVLKDEEVKSTSDKVVTEFAANISGYRAASRLQYITLTADESQNIITFYYGKIDSTKGFVEIYHWIENPTRPGTYLKTEYAYVTDFDAPLTGEYQWTPLKITGYTFVGATYDPENKVATPEGLLINAYYNCSGYEYTFNFVEWGTGKQLADPITNRAEFGSVVSQDALEIPGYRCITATPQTITISEKESQNVRKFSYVENTVNLTYSTTTGGTVDNERESIKAVTGEAAGATATAVEGYRFVGWYADEACTELLTTDAKYVPERNATTGIYESKEYFAKFEATTTKVTAKYLFVGTDTVIASSSEITGQQVGGTTTAYPIEIEGYSPVKESESIVVSSDSSKNVINFYYYKSLTLKANDGSATYTGKSQSVSGYTYTGALEGYVPSFSGITAGGSGTDAGTYETTVAASAIGTVDSTGRYKVTATEKGSFVIAPAEITVKTESAQRVYNGTALTAGGKVSGLVNNEKVTLDVRGSQTAVGSSQNIYSLVWDKTAKQANYSIKEDIGTLTVIEYAGQITVTTAGGTWEFDGSIHTPTVSVDGLPAGYTVEKATSDAFIFNVGSVYANCTNLVIKNAQGEDVTSKLNIKKVEGVLKVTPKAVTVTVDNKSKVYGEADPALTAEVSGTLSGEKSLISYSLSRAAGEKVGRYAITATGDATQGNYSVTYVPAELTITKADTLTVTGTDYNQPYDGSAHGSAASANVTEDTTIYYSTDGGKTWSENVPTITNVGTVNVSVKAVNENYEDVTDDYTLKVSAKKVTVTADNNSKVYGTKDDPEFTATVSGLVGEDTVNYSLTRDPGEDVATYTITASGYATQGNYSVTFVDGEFEITQSSAWNLDMTGVDYEGTYDGEKHGDAPAPSVTTGTTVSYSTDGGKTWTTTVPQVKDVKDSTHVIVKAENPNYVTITKEYDLTVNPKSVTVTANDLEKTYGTDDPDLTVKIDGTVGKDTIDYTISRKTGSDVGEYVIEVTGEEDQGNYTVSFTNGKLKINQSEDWKLILTGAGFEGKYDGTAHGGPVTADVTTGTTIYYSVDGGTNWTTGYPTVTDVDDSKTIKVKAENKNYKTLNDEYTITVQKREVTLTSADGEKVYDGSALVKNEQSDVAVTGDGWASGEGAAYTFTGTQTNAGSSENSFSYTLNSNTKENNYTITTKNGTLKVTKANTMTVEGKGYNEPYDGQSHSVSATATPSEGSTIYYSTDGGNTWKKEAPSITTVGSLTVKIKVTNPNYEDATDEVNLVVTRAAVTVTADNKNKVYGKSDPTLTAQVAGVVDDFNIQYTLSRAEGESVGKYSIVPSATAEQGNYTVSCVNGEFEITRSTELTVTGTDYSGTYDAASHGAAASASVTKGTTISYSTDNKATWSTEVPTITNVGKTTVYVKAENADYETAESSYTLEVTAKDVTVTAVSDSKVYGGTDPEFTATESGLLGSDTLSYTVTRAAGEDVAEYVITPSGAASQGNYSVTYVPATFTITKASTMTVSGTDYTGVKYDGKAYGDAAVPSVTEETTVKYSTDGTSYSETVPQITDAGTITVYVKAENKNYETATCTYTLNVEKRSIEFTSASESRVYTGAALTNSSVKTTGDGFINGESATFAVTGSQTNVGSSDNEFTYTLVNAKAGNYDIKTTFGKLEITASDEMTISCNGYEGTYDGAVHQPYATAKVTSGTTISYTTDGGKTWSTTAPSITNAGEVTVQAKAENANYITKTVDYTLKVNPKAITVAAKDASKVYGATDPALTADVTKAIGVDTISYSLEREAGENVGTYAITASGDASQYGGNYSVTFTGATFEITKSDGLSIVNIEGNKYEGVYDAAAHGIAVTPSVTDGTTVYYSVDGGQETTEVPTITDVGTKNVAVRVTNPNYNDVTGSYTLKVTPAAVTVKANNGSKNYGDTDPELTAEVTGNVGGGTIKYTVTRKEGEDVGTYTITPSGDKSQGNYTVSYETGTFTISRSGQMTVTGTDYSGEYDGQAHGTAAVPSVTDGTTVFYSVDGGEESEDVPWITNVGKHTISVRAENANYDDATCTYTLEVTYKAVTVTAVSTSKIYGNADPTFTVTTEGTIGSDTVSYSVSREKAGTEEGKNVNKYAINVTGNEIQDNYKVTFVDGIFEIKKSTAWTLDINSAGYSGVYDGSAHGTAAVPSVEGSTVTYSIDGGKTWTSSYPQVTNVSDSTEVLVKAENPNYETINTKYNLTVISKAVKVTADDKSKKYGEDDPELTATVEGTVNGETVQYKLNRVPGINVGEYDITASGDADQGNYKVTFAKGTFTIEPSTELALETDCAKYTGKYDGKAHGSAAEPSIVDDTTVSYSTDGGQTWSSEVPTVTDVADSTTVNVKAENPNFNTVEKTYDLTVTKRTVVLTSATDSKVYDKTPLTRNEQTDVTVSEDKFVDGEGATYTITGSQTIAGSSDNEFTYVLNGNTKAGNYDISTVAGKLTVNKSTKWSVTGAGYTGAYDGTAHFASASATETEGTVIYYSTDDGENWSSEAPSITNFGSQNVKVKAVNPNFEDTYDTVVLTITRAMVTVTADNKNKVYGDTDPEFTAQYTGLIGKDTINVTFARTEGSKPGTYTITPSGETMQGNYEVSYKTGTLTIAKAKTLTVSGTNYEGIYDGTSHGAAASPSVTDGTTVSYSVDGGTTWSTTVPKVTGVADVTVKVKAENENYETATCQYTLKVTGKAVTVTADDGSKTYGAADPALTANTEGTLNGDTVEYTVTRAGGDDAGTYTITASGEKVQGNYVVTYVSATFTINKSDAMSVSATDYSEYYDGESHGAAAVATVTAGTTIYYSTDSGKNWTTEVPTVKDVETVNVSVEARNSNYETATTTYSLVVTARPVTLTSATVSKDYDGTALTDHTVTVGGEGFATGESADCTVTGTQTAAGSSTNAFTYTLSGAKAANYEITKKEGTLTVNPSKALTISADNYSDTYDGKSHSKTATANITEGTTITYSTNGVDFTSNIPEIKNVGEVNVTAKAENANYVTATCTYKLTVAPKAVTVTAVDASKAYNEKDPALTANVDGTLGSDTVNYTVARAAGEDEGTYTITPSGEEKQGNYTVKYKTGTFTILPAGTLTVSGTSIEKTYDGNTYGVAATANVAGATFTYSKDGGKSWTSEVPTITDAGTINVTVKASAKNYTDATATYTLKINKRAVTVTSGSDSKNYDGEALTNSDVFVTEDGFVSGQGLDITFTGTRTAAGSSENTFTYTYKNGTKADNYNLSVAYGTLTVLRSDSIQLQGLEAAGCDVTYDAKAHGGEVTATEGATVSYSIDGGQTWNTIAPSRTNAGTTTVNVKAEKENYNTKYGSYTLKVNQKAVTVVANAASKTYNETDPALTATVDGLVKGESTDLIKYTVTRKSGENVGEYAITASGETDQGNYTVSYSGNTFAINRSKAMKFESLEGNNYAGEYDGQAHGEAAVPNVTEGTTVTYSTDGENWSETVPTVKDVTKNGSGAVKPVTVQVKAVNPNYEDATGSYTLQVNYRTVTVTADDKGKVYGAADPELTATVSDKKLEGDTIAYSISRKGNDGVGVYDIVPSGDVHQGNYEVSYVNGHFTISRSDILSITTGGFTGTYDGQTHGKAATANVTEGTTISYRYSTDGGDTWSDWSTTDVPTRTDAGVTKVEVKAVNDNYNEKTAKYNIEIAKAGITINTESKSKEYDGIALVANGSIAGLKNGESVTFKVTGNQTDVGTSDNTYTLVFDGTAKEANYTVSATVGKLEVKKNTSEIRIVANDATKVYDGTELTQPNFKWYGKLPDGEKLVVVTEGSVTNVGTAVNEVKSYQVLRGTEDITAFYTFSKSLIESGKLEVTKRNVTLTSASDYKDYDGAALVNNTITESEDGFVTGEGVEEYSFDEHSADAGTYSNTYRIIKLKNGTDANNYNVTTKYGTLIINQNKTMTVDGEDYSAAYDGQTHGEAAEPSVADGTTVEYQVNGGDWKTEVPTITNVGKLEVNVRATNKNYVTATDSYTLEVTGKNVTVKANGASKTYGTDDPALKATVEGLVEGESTDLIKYTVTRVGGEAVGTYTITPAGDKDQGNYNVTYETADFTITQSDSLSFDNIANNNYEGDYDGNSHGSAAEPSITEGTTVTYSTDGENWSEAVPTVKDVIRDKDGTVGAVSVKVKAENPNYKTATGEYTLKVKPVEVKVTADTLSKTYKEADPVLKATVEGLIEGESESLISRTLKRAQGEAAGEYDITVTGDANQGNYHVTFAGAKFTINKRTDLTITKPVAEECEGTYNGQPYGDEVTVNDEEGTTVSYRYSTDGGQTWSDWSTSYPTRTDAGVTKVEVKAVNPNYEEATADYTITVNRKAVTVTADDLGKTYAGSDPTLTATVEGLVEGESTDLIKYTVTRVGGETVGTYAITPSGDAIQGNYEVSYVSGTFTVSKYAGKITVTVTGDTYTYDGQPHKPVVTTSYIDENGNPQDGMPEGYTFKELTATEITDVARDKSGNVISVSATVTYEIRDREKGLVTDLDVVVKGGTMQINPAPLTITTKSANAVYTGKTLSAAGTLTGLVEGETATFEVTGKQTKVGSSNNTYKLTWNGTAKEGNYFIEKEEIGTLTITEFAEEIVVTTVGGSHVYDGETLKGSVQVSDLPEGYTVAVAKTDAEVTHVSDGKVEVKVTELKITNAEGEDVTASLNINKVEKATVEITPATLTVTTLGKSEQYSGNPVTAEGQVSGFVGAEDADFEVTGTQTFVGSSKNTYSIKFKGEEGASAKATAYRSDYDITTTMGDLEVTEPTDSSKVVSKSAQQKEYKLGETITYTINVTNIYATKKSITINEMPGMVVEQNIFTDVEPGASISTTATHVVTEEDIVNGKVSNNVAVEFSGSEKDYPGTEEVPTEKKNSKLTLTKTSKIYDAETKAVKAKADLGDRIEYSITVKNSGNVTISDVKVVDEFAGYGVGKELDFGTIAPEQEVTKTVNHTVTEADIMNGSITNEASASGTDPEEQPTKTDGNVTNETEELDHTLYVEKTSKTEGPVALGETITYAIKVTNVGNVTVSGIVLEDELTGNVGEKAIQVGTLEPGQTSEEYTVKYVVTEEDIRTGYVLNTATVSGKDPKGGDSENEGEKKIPTVKEGASLAVEKESSVKGQASLGEKVTYTITVTNNGNQTITDIELEDALTGNVGTNTIKIGTLKPLESKTVKVDYEVTEKDIIAGGLSNVATVTGKGPDEETITGKSDEVKDDTDPKDNKLTVVKTSDVDEDTEVSVGDVITYTITVTNTGNVTAKNVKVEDKLTGNTGDDAFEIGTLAPTESAKVTATYTVTEADVLAFAKDGTKIVNTAVATGTDPEDEESKGEGETSNTPEKKNNSIKATKKANVEEGYKAALGDVITWTITVENTGNVTVKNIKVEDELTGNVGEDALVIEEIEPGKSASVVTDEYRVTEADILRGYVANKATVKGSDGNDTPTEDDPEDNTPTEAKDNTLSVNKTSIIKDATTGLEKNVADLGDEIVYTIVVKNVGNVTANNVKVEDKLTGNVGEKALELGDLAPGKENTVTVSYIVTEKDLREGSIVNTATATGTDLQEEKTTGEGTKEDPTVESKASLYLVKTSDIADSAKVTTGDKISYTITLINNGNQTISGVKVEDKLTGNVGEKALDAGTLKPGDKKTWILVYTVTEEDVVNGGIVNTATAKGTDPDGNEIPGEGQTSTDTEDVRNTLVVTKTSSVSGTASLGEEITYTITVTNTGNVTVKNIKVEDELTGMTGFNAEIIESLAPGKSAEIRTKYVVTEADILKGSITNMATASGTDITGGRTETDGNVTNKTDDLSNTLTVTKTDDVAAGATASLGQVINYTITVKNSGNVTAKDVEVEDILTGNTGDKALKLGTILPGQSKDVKVAYTVTENDIARGYVANTATVKGVDPNGDPTTGGDEERTPTDKKNNTLQVVKTANTAGPVYAGDEITYTITVTNKGNVTVNDIRIEDALTGNTGANAIYIGTLEPNDARAVSVSYTVTAADVERGSVVNSATVTGEDITGEEPQGVGNVDVPTFVERPGISVNVVPSAPNGTVFQPGDTITYTVTITNNGNVILNNVAAEDTLTGAKWNIGTLPIGESVTFTTTYTLTEGDAFRLNGTLTNTVLATGVAGGTTVAGTSTVSDHNTATVNILNAFAQITVDKQYTNKVEILKVGDVMQFTITVTNSGNVTLYNVKVTDNLKNAAGSIAINSADGGKVSGNVVTFDQIAAGATKTIKCSYTVVEKDNSNAISNSATATGESADGKKVSDDSDETDPTTVKKTYKMIIHYVDKNGEKVTDDFVGEYYEGEEFVIEAPEADGYLPAYLKIYSPEGGMPARDIELSVIMHDEDGFVPASEGRIELDESGKVYEIVSLDKGEVPLDAQALDGDHYCILHILIFLAALILFIIFLFDNRKHQKRIEELENQIKEIGGRE